MLGEENLGGIEGGSVARFKSIPVRDALEGGVFTFKIVLQQWVLVKSSTTAKHTFDAGRFE